MQSSKTPWFDYSNINTDRPKDKHAIIIGAGIAGCQMSWHLTRLNWKVTLIERHGSLAQEASGNQAGIISPKITAKPSAGEDFYVDAFNYTLQQLKTLGKEKGFSDWHPCGVLQLAHNERENNRWHALKQREFDTRFLQAVTQSESNKIAGIETHHKAIWFPKAGWIKPRSVCKTLSKHPACKIIHSNKVLSVQQDDNKLWQVSDNKGQLISSAPTLIIASGKDLASFKQSQFLAGIPILGQTTTATATKYSKKLTTIIGHEGYLIPNTIPNSTGTEIHFYGATFEKNFNSISSSSDADKKNTNQLAKFIPELTDSYAQITSAHTAVRFTTPDRFPYAGALPDVDFYLRNYHDLHQGKHWKKYPGAEYQQGLYVLGGFGSRGLTTSGLCANLLAKQINHANTLSEKEKKLLHLLHPARFIIKNLKKNNSHDH